MRATVMYAAGDVRIDEVPDARVGEPTDAVLRVTRACICGSDLWPYKSMEPEPEGRRMGHEFIGVVEDAERRWAASSAATWWWRPSCGPTAPASSASRACTRRACTAGSG